MKRETLANIAKRLSTMSTLLQLLANYYQSVVSSELLYYQHINRGNLNNPTSNGSDKKGGINSSNGSEREMLLLQRQVHQLTSELQRQSHENDTLKELQKAQRALMESKLNNCKKTIGRLRKQHYEKSLNGDAIEEVGGGQLKKREQHLLSPLVGRKLEGVGKTKGLRRALTSGQQTLFDDGNDDDDRDGTVDRINDVNFVGSIKRAGGKNNRLAQAVITSAGISDREQEKPLNKKRKLTSKRIQNVSTDSEID